MIQSHKKKSNTAAGVWLVTMAILVRLFLSGKVEGNVWSGSNLLVATVVIVHCISMAIAFWFYSKAKGYWGILGVALIFFSLFGLIVLVLFPDRRPEPSSD